MSTFGHVHFLHAVPELVAIDLIAVSDQAAWRAVFRKGFSDLLSCRSTISDDWVVLYDNRFFQPEPQSRHYAPAKGQVVVCEAQGERGTFLRSFDTRVTKCLTFPPERLRLRQSI
jgi:hypothetical protein